MSDSTSDKSLTLFGITNELQEQIDRLMNPEYFWETEADNAQWLERMQELEQLFSKKIWACTWYLLSKESNIEMISMRIKQMEALLAREKKNKESFKQYILMSMQRMWQMEIETGNWKLSIRDSKSVHISDESLLPEQFIRTKVDKSPDKAAIKEALDSWQEVPWAVIQINSSLQLKV